jgi:putative ABC transport system permease protein
MNIPMLRGRDVNESDDMGSPGVLVVNETMARNFWPGENPLGKRIALVDPLQAARWMTVVGEAKDSKQDNWVAAPYSEIFLPYLQAHDYLNDMLSRNSYLTLVVRANGNPAPLTSAVEGAAWALDKNVTISQVQTMEQAVEDSNAQPRFYVLLLGTFAAIALILAAVGIYGVMSYSVSRRTHEIGVRMALGAEKSHVLKLVTGQGMLLALAGTAVGLAGALPLTRLMASLLYAVRPSDPLTFIIVPVVLIGVALLASYIPARRAMKVDPMVALRHE